MQTTTDLCSQSVFQIFLEEMEAVRLLTKEHPDCYERPGSVMLWGCISVLEALFLFCDGSSGAEKNTEILEQHLLPSGPHLLQDVPSMQLSRPCKPHSGHMTKT